MSPRAHGLLLCCIVGAACASVNAPAAQKTAAQKAAAPALTRFEFSEPHMGTLVRIVLYAPDPATAKKAAQAGFARVAELNRIMSDYQDDSELMTLCKKSGGLPVSVSDDLFTVLRTADDISRLSSGAFDVTVGPLSRLWRRTRRTLELPTPAELKKAMALVGHTKLRLDPRRRSVQLLVDGMLIDLGGIAKGYAAEAVLLVLRRHGITRGLVALGGDIAVSDAPPGTPGWKIAVATPGDTEGSAERFLTLTNRAVSTSGDANQFVTIAGKRYSHVLDPRTGMGLVGRRSVTVVAARGVLADGFDTAVCVLGIKAGMKLIEGRPDLACHFVEENARGQLEAVTSSRFPRFLPADKK